MLERAKIISGSELTLYVLRSNGRCDAEEEVLSLAQERDKAQELLELFKYIAANSFRTPSSWFKKLKGWDDIWEIRKFGRFRIYCFMVSGAELYLCACEYKKGMQPNKSILQRVARLRDEWLDVCNDACRSSDSSEKT